MTTVKYIYLGTGIMHISYRVMGDNEQYRPFSIAQETNHVSVQMFQISNVPSKRLVFSHSKNLKTFIYFIWYRIFIALHTIVAPVQRLRKWWFPWVTYTVSFTHMVVDLNNKHPEGMGKCRTMIYIIIPGVGWPFNDYHIGMTQGNHSIWNYLQIT